MTLAQIAFLVLWPIFSLVGIIAVYKNRKHNGKERFFFSVIFLIVPIFSALLYLLVTYRDKVFFWSNSATKDKVWIAETDISHGSDRGNSIGGDGGSSSSD